jgi:hypothetical protein
MKKTNKILASTLLTGALVMQSSVSNAQGASSVKVSSDEAIRPFQFHASQANLDDLRRRILATKWPEKEPVDDQSQGVQLATMKALAKY